MSLSPVTFDLRVLLQYDGIQLVQRTAREKCLPNYIRVIHI